VAVVRLLSDCQIAISLTESMARSRQSRGPEWSLSSARFVSEGTPERVLHPFENKATKKIKSTVLKGVGYETAKEPTGTQFSTKIRSVALSSTSDIGALRYSRHSCRHNLPTNKMRLSP
jgi:hypothetical protein